MIEIKTLEVPTCKLCGSEMDEGYSTRSLSYYYVCKNKYCKYSDKLGVYDSEVIFKDKEFVSVESLPKLIKKEIFELNQLCSYLCSLDADEHEKAQADGLSKLLWFVEALEKELKDD
jgi:hypothetical protein